MTAHLPDYVFNEIADGLVSDGDLHSANAHLSECSTCADKLARLTTLLTRLRALPKEVPLQSNLRYGKKMPRLSAPRIPAWLSGAVAATILLVIGFALGRQTSALSLSAPEVTRTADSRTVPQLPVYYPTGAGASLDGLAAAERVQLAGTMYLTALAMLGNPDVPRSAVGQGREAAIATLYGAVMELERQGRSSNAIGTVANLLQTERKINTSSARITTHDSSNNR
jgi:hypothetical protein